MRRLSIIVLTALACLGVLAVSSVIVARPADWLLWTVTAVLVASGAAAILACIISVRPYKAERRLGYTTWPSEGELKG